MLKSIFELSGAELDYAVSKAAGLRCELRSGEKCTFFGSDELFEPSVNWMQGGPVIEMAQLRVEPPSRGMKLWSASAPAGGNAWGMTLLEAAMRCFVAARLGEEIFIQPATSPAAQPGQRPDRSRPDAA